MQVFHISFWLNINHINFSSKMDIFVLNANKMCKNDQIIKCISLKFSLLPSWLYFVQKVIRCEAYFICIFEFLDHIKFCKVELDIFKVHMECIIYYAHFYLYFKWKCEEMKKIRQNIQIDTENLYRSALWRLTNHILQRNKCNKCVFCWRRSKRWKRKRCRFGKICVVIIREKMWTLSPRTSADASRTYLINGSGFQFQQVQWRLKATTTTPSKELNPSSDGLDHFVDNCLENTHIIIMKPFTLDSSQHQCIIDTLIHQEQSKITRYQIQQNL